ncbi:MAG: AlpA family phage regulatory protein [Candidatus Thiothrix moscowensis]|nr:AlpA family phage regulatory protein [Candidatus Thiothrix moscowensis]
MTLLKPRKPKAGEQTGIEPATITTAVQERFIRMPELEHLTGYKKSSIYQLIRDGKFPDRVKLSRAASVWKLSEINAWMQGTWTPAAAPPAATILKLVRNSNGGAA